MHIHDIVENFFSKVEQGMDPKIFHNPLRKILKYIAQKNGNYNDQADQLKGIQRTVNKISLFGVIIKISQNISPAIRFNSCFSIFVLSEQGTEKRRQQSK